MEYTIKQIRYLLDNKMKLIPKCLGVELVRLGFLKYEKLNYENYYYWWYEVSDLSKLDKNKFTYKWEDMIMTKKCEWLFELIDYHENSESIYKLIEPILNLESAKNEIDIKTGKKQTDILIEMYYGNRVKKHKQLELVLNCA